MTNLKHGLNVHGQADAQVGPTRRASGQTAADRATHRAVRE